MVYGGQAANQLFMTFSKELKFTLFSKKFNNQIPGNTEVQ